MDEPSVLDYVKSKLAFWRHSSVQLPAEPAEMDANPPAEPAAAASEAVEKAWARPVSIRLPVRTLSALILALLAQAMLQPPSRAIPWGVAFYTLAGALAVWAYLRGEWKVLPLKEEERATASLEVRRLPFLIGIPLALLAFLAFGGGLFNSFNLFVWGLALACFVWALWIPEPGVTPWHQRLRAFLARREWSLTITPFTLLLAASLVLVIFFRVYQLNSVPPEMVSDHAEKLLDVSDVLNGRYSIFFPRNTGREAIAFYLSAAIIDIFHTGLTFLTLKIGMVSMGLLTLVFVYLLGKELGNRWVGLYAVLFAGIAYWPNVIARVALRFTLYPLLVAPTMYFLIRGLRRSNRNDFIWAGIALGIGLHGYTSFRIVPFLVVLAVILYLLHRQSKGARNMALLGLGIIALVSLVVFLPLFRYALEHPEMFAYRAFTRLSDWEHPLPGSPIVIFLSNLWNAVTMFFWSNGSIWVHSVVDRPALDVVSGALFFFGVVFLLVRYIRQHNWTDLFLILSVPMLMMPSILSLAFPGENPSLNRTGGAIIPVFLIIALAFDGLLRAVKDAMPPRSGRVMAWSLGLVLVFWSATQNYDLVFNQYETMYRQSSWNSSEMGQVIRDFADSVGTPNSAWVVAYPYWVDTRLVGINAGYATKDYAIAPDQLQTTQADPHAKLFLVNTQDTASQAALRALYPQGSLSTYSSKVPTKDFLMFFVPPEAGAGP